MNRSILIGLAFLATGWEAKDKPAKHPADAKAVASGITAFGFDLNRHMTGDGNRFFSPLSASTALSMTYAGAKGDTAAEMAKTLRYPFEGERLHLGYAQYRSEHYMFI
ncbi:MAG: hypothetical protein K2W96_26520 [Gemmataceae bacterium]|nr:hypothetical protein [Gemmataceae bacterium]